MRLAAIAAFWRRLPVIVRAVFVGSLISSVGHFADSLYFANTRFWRTIPWSTPLVILYLWFFWQYAQGRWRPASTAQARRRNVRASSLSPRLWRWSLLALGLWFAGVAAINQPLVRLDPPHLEFFYRLFQEMPFLTLAAILFTASTVAGIVEETAYRGYMQSMIERQHGPVIAISVVTIFFMLAHLTDWTQPLTILRAALITVISVGYGIVARACGSIRPGVVMHSVGNAFGFCVLACYFVLVGPLSFRPQPVKNVLRDPRTWFYFLTAAILFTAALLHVSKGLRGSTKRVGHCGGSDA